MADIKSDKAMRGRPRIDQRKVRSNRIVSFVTDTELEKLERLAQEDDRSLSAVVHRIIMNYFQGVTR
jgi:hypothetical protein